MLGEDENAGANDAADPERDQIERRQRPFQWPTSPPVLASAASFASSSIDFRAQMFAKKCASEKHCLSMIFLENRYPLFQIML
jgi:hypothetical protein